MVTRAHPGQSSLGCLTMLLVLVTVAYFGFNIGQAWSDYYSLRDSMRQQARFGSRLSDAEIRRALVAKVDSLGLPEEAAGFEIRREPGRIVISTEYVQPVELPLFIREFRFAPRAEAPR